MEYPVWPLGIKFIDAKRRSFEIVHVIMGDEDAPLNYTIDCHNGWKLTIEPGENKKQTKVGFINISEPNKVIYESVENLSQFFKQGYLHYE